MELFQVAFLVLSSPVLVTSYALMVIGLRRLRLRDGGERFLPDVPTVSVVVPAKDEEAVIGRTLESIKRVNYPEEKLEILMAVSESSDRTVEICRRHSLEDGRFKLIYVGDATKAEAINAALKACKGEVVVLLDADCVLDPEAINKAVWALRGGGRLAAVQAIPLVANSGEGLLVRIAELETLLWGAIAAGKSAIGSFVHVIGSGAFIRRDVMGEVGPLDASCLAEDAELAVRIVERGYRIEVHDAFFWEEFPARVSTLIRQRLRWFRGLFEVALKHLGLVLRKPVEGLDVILTLLSPLSGVAFAAGNALFLPRLISRPLDPMSIVFLVLVLLILAAFALPAVVCGDRKATSRLTLLPLIYPHLLFMSLLSLVAAVQVLLRTPVKRVRTEKSGRFSPQLCWGALPANQQIR